MVHSKTLKISIGTIIKNPEMLRFVFHHLKTKTMCQNAVKKLPLVINYVPDQYKTLEICDKVIIENSRMLGFILDCYKDQKNCDKPVIIILMHYDLSQIGTRLKKCVIKLSVLILLQYNLFLNALSLKK